MRAVDYDALIRVCQHLVPADVRLDMCRHLTIRTQVYWCFMGDSQIGVVTEVEGACPMRWRASRILRGQSVSEKIYDSLAPAFAHATAQVR